MVDTSYLNFIEPCKLPEANIQARLFCKLQQAGVPTYLEYKHKNCRFDIVILSPNQKHILAIVEVKSWQNPNRTPKENGKQFLKYQEMGVPILYCGHINNIDQTVKKVYKIYKNFVEKAIKQKK